MAPVNAEMANWTAQAVQADWAAWRSQWEFGHAARALLLIAGLSALVLSGIAETPTQGRADPSGVARLEPR